MLIYALRTHSKQSKKSNLENIILPPSHIKNKKKKPHLLRKLKHSSF